MSVNPMVGNGADSLGKIMPYLQMAKGGYDLLGAARRGRISQGLGAAMNLYSGYQGMNKPGVTPEQAPSSDSTTQSKFGMTRDEFMSLDPELRQRMLQQLMGR